MYAELYGKGGRLCRPALEGQLRCPLMVRPTSEDVVTGHLVQVLRILNPRWLIPDLLNRALGAPRFRRQIFRRFRVEPWVNKPAYPRELLPWAEGSTQVDIALTWENPPTTVYIEAKLGSGLAVDTAGNHGQQLYPGDQLCRNARVGLFECGWFQTERLFTTPPRDFVVILLSPANGNPLVANYREPAQLLASIPHSHKLTLPRLPFIGALSYPDIIYVSRCQKPWFSRPERHLIEDLIDYLSYKQAHLR